MTPAYGIFARVFPAGPAPAVAAAVADAGYSLVQLNLRAVGLPTIPAVAEWRSIDAPAIRDAFTAAGVACWGLSCSYNMAHPDASVRRAGTADAVELIRRAPSFGVRAVTLCTGSRNAERMWAYHPDNATAAAWCDMRAELDLLLEAAAAAGVVLGIEPEPGNVISDAGAAARLYAELAGDGSLVGIVADSANLLARRAIDEHARILAHAFATLSEHIVCLHAKDLVPWSETLAGRGVVDYVRVASLHAALGTNPPVIVQDVAPDQASAAREFLADRFGA